MPGVESGQVATTPAPSSTTADQQPRLTYQPALDGIRAVAVLAVMAFHSSMSWAKGGEFGVDLFFVLSGFLITTLLLEEYGRSKRISLSHFYDRRIRRLFPALLLVLAFVAVYALFIADPTTLHNLRWDGISALTYWSNWWFIFSHQSYFASFTVPSPLRHVWSLSVEEQWYVVWPLLMFGLLRLFRGRVERLIGVIVGLTAVSVLLMAVLSHGPNGASRVYYGTDTRAQTLLIGSLLAAILHRWPVRQRRTQYLLQVVGIGAAAVLAVMMIRVDGQTQWMFDGGYALFAIAGAAVIAAVMMPNRGPIKETLRIWPLVAIGRISYGLYLWHWPIDVWLTPDRIHLYNKKLFLVRSVVAIAAATVSYFLVEKPIRTRQWNFRRPRLVALQAAGVAALVFVAATAVGPLHSSSASGSVNGALSGRPTAAPTKVTAPPTTFPVNAPTPAAPTNRKLRAMVVGDSVGWTLSWAMSRVPNIVVRDAARIGCSLLPSGRPIIDGKISQEAFLKDCEQQDKLWLAAIVDFKPDVVVLSYGAWEVYDQVMAGGKTLKMFSTKYREAMLQQLRYDLDFIATYSHARVVLLDVLCFHEQDPSLGGPNSVRNDPTRGAWVQSVLDEFARQNPQRVAQASLRPFLCPGGAFRGKLGGVTLRPDGVHYSVQGAALTWRYVLGPQIMRIAHKKSLP